MPRIMARLPRRQFRAALAATGLVLALVMTAVLATGSGEGPAPALPVTADGGSAPALRVTTDGGSAPLVSPSAAPDRIRDPIAEPLAAGTSKQDEYAALIGSFVFEMDARTSTAAQVRERLRREADPQLSDDGLGDLYATIDVRVPADPLWQRMRSNEQWSEWARTRIWEPAAWAQVVTGGHAEPGWVMRNVTGVQTTHYVEDGLSRSTSREATLTLVMRCPGNAVDRPRCRLVLISTQPVF